MTGQGVHIEYTSDMKRVLQDQHKSIQGLERQVAALKKLNRQGAKTGRGLGKMATDVKTALVGAGGLTVAVALVNRGFETWLRNSREITAEVRRASEQIVAFAALQEGGKKAERVVQAELLGARKGITDRGVAFGTVQALQSAYAAKYPDLTEQQAFNRGMAAAETIFAATQLGVPLEQGRELEVIGASLGLQPGVAIRRAYVAGQLSSRDPATISRAAAAFAFYNDNVFANAAAGVIAGAVSPEQIRAHVQAGGIGLSKISAEGFQDTLKRLGVADATAIEKVRALAGAGITTPEELKMAGLGEMKQQVAVSALVRGVDALEGYIRDIPARAQRGLLTEERKAVEREIPTTKTAREIAVLEAAHRMEKAFGAAAKAAADWEYREKLRGLALRRLGMETIATFDAIDEEGRVNWFRGRFFRWLIDTLASGAPGMREGKPPKVQPMIELIEQEEAAIEREFGLRGWGKKGTTAPPAHRPTGGPVGPLGPDSLGLFESSESEELRRLREWEERNPGIIPPRPSPWAMTQGEWEEKYRTTVTPRPSPWAMTQDEWVDEKLRELAGAAEAATEKLKTLSDAAENVTVNPEPLE